MASEPPKAYTVLLKPAAERALQGLGQKDQRQVARRIDSLTTEPRAKGEKLRGIENLYRIRAGDYRIIYEVHDDALRVLVVTMGNRKDVYRRLR